MSFAHLHVHTHYSFLQGALRIKDLCARAKELGMDSVAMTDRGNMYGAIEFAKTAKATGIKPIFGCEVIVVGDRTNAHDVASTSLVLLAETDLGYRNLIALVSHGWLEGFHHDTPRVDRVLVAAHHEGLIAMSGGLAGDVGQAILRRDFEKAAAHAQAWLEIFGPEHYFLQVERVGFAENRRVNDALFGLSDELGIRCVATNYAHYKKPDDARSHAALVCIGLGKSFAAISGEIPNSLYLRSEAEMREVFADHPEVVDCAAEIAARCNATISMGKTYLPTYRVPEGTTIPDYLRQTTRDGLDARFEELAAQGKTIDVEAYKDRLEVELQCIIQMDFPGYFLIVWDFIREARVMGVPVGPGRGSGAGSLVAYSLRITDIDPMQYGLLFERFLNPERVSMPDFDIDFCMNKRGQVIDYVTRKYGHHNVGQIITYGQLKAKAAIRDVGRVLDLSFAEVDRLAKLVPEELGITLTQAKEKEPRIDELFVEDARYRELFDVACRVEGLVRQAGMHAAGVVIGQEVLWHYVPICRGANGEIVTQYAKEEVELAGLVKFDFLGLKTLTVLDQAVKLVTATRAAKGEPAFNLGAIPMDDRRVFEIIAAGDTTGIFQLESSGFKQLMKELRADCFEDLIAAVALYRPGPIDSGMVDDFVKRKHGLAPIEYIHPALQDVLAETYGTIVYQEQVMTVARIIAGYSLGGADLLRRAMGKKKAEEMAKQKQVFLDGSKNTAIATEEQADRIFDLLAFFAGYGFNKSHSAAYALLSYQTGYLKAHYPVEFYAALMTCDGDNTDKVVRYIGDARAHNIVVKPPDVNLGDKDFSVDNGAIRFGLGAIKMVGEGAVDSIIDGRHDGPYTSLFDLCERVDLKKLNRRTLEQLVRSGACDGFNQERHVLFHNLERALERAQSRARDKASGQASLFDLLGGGESKGGKGGKPEDAYVLDGEAWLERVRLEYEKEAIGFYVSGHPLDQYKSEIKRSTNKDIAKIVEGHVADHEEVAIACIVVAIRERPNKNGDGRLAFVTFEDRSGQMEAGFFGKSYPESEPALKSGEPVIVTGRVRFDGEGDARVVKFRPDRATKLSDVRRDRTRKLALLIDASKAKSDLVHKLMEAVSAHRGDVRLTLLVDVPGAGRAVIEAADDLRVSPDDAFISAAQRLLGRDAVLTA